MAEYHHSCKGKMSAFAANWEKLEKTRPVLNPSSPQSPSSQSDIFQTVFGHNVSALYVEFLIEEVVGMYAKSGRMMWVMML